MDLFPLPKEVTLGHIRFNLLLSDKLLAGKDIDFAT